MTVSLGRMLDLTFRTAGETGIQGPNPRVNDLRVARRRHWRPRDFNKPRRAAPPFDETTALERFKALLEMLTRAQHALPEQLDDPAIRNAAHRLTQSADSVLRGVGWLDQRGRRPEVSACIREVLRRRTSVNRKLEAVETLAEGGRALPALDSYDESIRAYIEFGLALGQARDAEEAEAALDRLIAALLPEQRST